MEKIFHFLKVMLIVFFVVALVVAGIFIKRNYFFTFNHFKGENFKWDVISPTEKYVANAYYKPYGCAAGGVKVWVEVTDKDEGNTKTIYYSEGYSNFSMKWTGVDTLFITNKSNEFPSLDNSIELQVDKEIFHDEGLACKSLLMKDEYERCISAGSRN